jgi:hypothetical protein
MAITFPLALSAFSDLLRTVEFRWRLERFVEHSGTAIGDAITNEIAAPRWRADVALAAMPHDVAADLQALFEAIAPGGTFYLSNPTQPGPRDDPLGVTLASATPTIDALAGNVMAINGLPPGYTLRRGDMLHFDYGSDPTRRALHRVAEDVTADGSGLTASFEVRPFIRTGSTVGAAVTLLKPAAKMMFLPGSVDAGAAGLVVTSGKAFTAIEVR